MLNRILKLTIVAVSYTHLDVYKRQPLEIAPKIYDVGVVDWAVRDFHGYKTERGASYNSYLIMDEKICLIDTVKAMFAEELLAKIERVVDPGKIDYVIVNHVEPDHAGALPALVKACLLYTSIWWKLLKLLRCPILTTVVSGIKVSTSLYITASVSSSKAEVASSKNSHNG